MSPGGPVDEAKNRLRLGGHPVRRTVAEELVELGLKIGDPICVDSDKIFGRYYGTISEAEENGVWLTFDRGVINPIVFENLHFLKFAELARIIRMPEQTP